GIDNQARFFLYHVGIAFFLELIAVIGSAPILPDNGPVDGFSGLPVPDNGCLALIGNADGCNIFSVGPHFGYGLGDYARLAGPYLVGIVFHPTRFWKILFKLSLGCSCYLAFMIKYDGPGAGGSLIEC